MAAAKGAVIVVTNELGQVLLLKRSASASHHAGMWENPGGKLEPGESYLEAAKRELQEEAGIQSSEFKELFDKVVGDDERNEDFQIIVFSVVTSQTPNISESTFSEWAWVNKADLASFDLASYVEHDFKFLGYLE